MELVNPESEETKEMAKWEQFPSKWTLGSAPGNPWTMRAYPWMLYKAKQLPNGKWSVAEEPPAYFGYRDAQEWDRACQGAAAFTASCQRTVNSEAEHQKARAEGWRDNPTEAMELVEVLNTGLSDAAAERNYQDRNMSEKAKAEVAKVEADHFGHLGEIPEQKPDRMAAARAAKAARKAAGEAPPSA
jgi:hypothetical protein